MKKIIFVVAICHVCACSVLAQIAPNLRNRSPVAGKQMKIIGGSMSDEDKKKINLSVFGAGAFTKALNESNGQNNQGLGAVGGIISNYNFQLGFMFNFTDMKNITFKDANSFGQAILIPAQGSASATMDIRYYNDPGRNTFFGKRWGWYFNATGFTGSTWTYKDSTVHASPISLKAQLSFYPFPDVRKVGDNDILISFDFGYSGRYLTGDVAQDDGFRKTTLGTTKKSFNGIEFTGNFWINDLRLFFSLPVLSGPDIRGLTGPQLVIGVSLSGTAIKITQ